MTQRERHESDLELSEPVERAPTSDRGTPDDAAIARMQARLEASLGAAFDEEVERPSAAARSASQLRRLGWVGAGALVAVGALWWSSRPGALEPSPSAAALAVLEPQTTVASLQQSNDPPAPPPQPQPHDDALQPAEPPAQLRPQGDHAKRRSDSPRAAGRSTARKRKPAADGGAPVASAPSEAPEAGLAEELSGLDRIRSLVTTSPEAALAVAEQQARQFPRGALGPERAFLQLRALVRLGRTSEAQQLALQLLADPRNQAYRTLITEILATAR